MIPGQASTHHEDADSADERGDVTHVGEAVPLIIQDSWLRHDHKTRGQHGAYELYVRMDGVWVPDRLADA